MSTARKRRSLSPAEELDRTPSFSGENRAPTASTRPFGVPSLSVLVGRKMGQLIGLQKPATTVGRADDCAILLPDEGVSRRHALFRRRGPLTTIADLSSRNGTFVNGKRITSAFALSPGDAIRFGPYATVRFALHDGLDERMHNTLYERATRDPLTSALNRRSFDERTSGEWSWARRHAQPLAMVCIDIDHFKTINDRFGHRVGDLVLTELAGMLRRTLREEDALARIGGEEFAVLARATSLPDAMAMGERIRFAIQAHPFMIDGQHLTVTASIGVAASSHAGPQGSAELMARADAAMYVAKQQGRNRVVGASE